MTLSELLGQDTLSTKLDSMMFEANAWWASLNSVLSEQHGPTIKTRIVVKKDKKND